MKYIILFATCGTYYGNPDVQVICKYGYLSSELRAFIPNLRAAGMFLTLPRHDAMLVERLNHYHTIIRR